MPSGNSASAASISRSTAEAVFSALAPGDEITVAGTGGNDNTYIIQSVSTDGREVVVDGPLANEGPLNSTATITPEDTDTIKIVDTSSASTTANYVTQLVAKVKDGT